MSFFNTESINIFFELLKLRQSGGQANLLVTTIAEQSGVDWFTNSNMWREVAAITGALR